jgi:hypothetical protein
VIQPFNDQSFEAVEYSQEMNFYKDENPEIEDLVRNPGQNVE